MLYFLNLIRYKNLFIIALTQLLFKYFLIDAFFTETALTYWQFILLVASTLFIAAGGYIINDIQDIVIDKINKPKKGVVGTHISQKTAYYIYIGCTFIGVFVGFYLANAIERSGFSVLFVLTAGLLYYYAISLKRYLLLGNIIISFFTALSILLIGLFDVLPILTEVNIFLVKYVFNILLIYSSFAFYTNLLREIIKDIEDIDGGNSVLLE